MKGFVDLQVNGFLGIDFSEAGLTLEKVRQVVVELCRRGTVAFCPTIITSPPEIYAGNLPILAQAMEERDLQPHLLGIHVEGPCISPQQGARGAHSPRYVLPPSLALFEHFQKLARNRICLLTVAPELAGAEGLIRHAAAAGVTVSLGHHLADCAAIEKACAAGARACTHLGNGIPNLLPRHPNPIWDQLDEDRLAVMVIADGHHLPDSFLRVVCRLRAPRRLIVVSDAAPIAGLPPGRYQTLGNQAVLEESGRLWNPQENHLVGSSACMLECMNHLASITALSEEELWQVGYHNPLALVGKQIDEDRLAGLREVGFEDRRFRLRRGPGESSP